jgi:guanylate kinase
MKRLVVLAGPSCVGKSPLHAALARAYPELAGRLRKLVLYNSRPPRPGEVEGVAYHFRTRAEIESLRGRPDLALLEVRGDLQAVDLGDLRGGGAEDALFEGNPFVGALLLEQAAATGLPVLGVFVSPLSRSEVLQMREAAPGLDLPTLVHDLMRRKLLRRMTRQKGLLSLPDLEEVERRAGSAYGELRLAARFQYVLPNHDGEDSEHWWAFPLPLGDARESLLALASLLQGQVPARAEQWEEELLPQSQQESR